MATPKHKILKSEIMDCIERTETETLATRAARLQHLFFKYATDMIEPAWMYGQRLDVDLRKTFEMFQEAGYIPKGYIPEMFRHEVTAAIESFGWHRSMDTVDSSKLLQNYSTHKPGDTAFFIVRATTWFNGAVCDHNGKYYMAYRMDADPWTVNTRVAMCEVGEDFQPISGSNWLVDLPMSGTFAEDPRLFVSNGNLYLTYCDGFQIGLAMIDPNAKTILSARYLRKPVQLRMEKNWTFFTWEHQLYCVYKIAPHTIYAVGFDDMARVNKEPFNAPHWKWGWGDDVGGGACPIIIDGLAYSFFHSKTKFPDNMKGYMERQYHMGCYVFDPVTFKPVKMSKEPLFSGQYNPNIVTGGKYKAIIFPMSAMFSEPMQEWVITCGENDHSIVNIYITQKELEENLISL